MRSGKKSLSLEILEARALFAGTALAVPEFDLVAQALNASGPIEASFDPKLPNRLVLHGAPDVDLTIDFDKLPSTVTSIDIAHFDSVKFEGKDVLYNLFVTDVRALEAPQIDIWGGGIITSNVEKLTLNSVHGDLLMAGDKMDAKINDLGGTSVVLKLNALVLETQSKSLSLVSMVNDQAVIALPIVPSSWDPVNPKSWRGLSGFEDVSTQIRLGTRDVSLQAAPSDSGSHHDSTNPTSPANPATPSPSTPPVSGGHGGNADERPITPTTPITPPLAAEIDLRSYLDRLEIMFNKVGGFEATGFDIGTVKRVVAELRQSQQAPQTFAPGELVVPDVNRRAFLTESSGTHFDGHDFAPAADTKTPVAVGVDGDVVQIPHGVSASQTEDQHEEIPPVLVDAPLRLPDGDNDLPSHTVHVTVDPEAPVESPQSSLLGVISLLVDRAMDLKQYVIHQLSQEVMPGERTGVLLVDPKPVRPSQQTKFTG